MCCGTSDTGFGEFLGDPWEMNQLGAWAAWPSHQNMEIKPPLWDIVSNCDIGYTADRRNIRRAWTGAIYGHTKRAGKRKKVLTSWNRGVYIVNIPTAGMGATTPVNLLGEQRSKIMKKQYQVCTIDRAAKTATALEVIEADTLQDAITEANAKHLRDTIRIYPLVTMDSPDTITEMAKFTLASVENWERRNNYAVMNPIRRNQWDREDYESIATLAIIATLTDSPGATMYEVKSAAFSAIRAYQAKQDRNSEREYNPGWTACNIQPRTPRATCPALDRLISRAIDATAPTLSPAQMEIFTLSYQEEMSAADIAEKTGKSRGSVYQGLYRSHFWVLSKAVELDKDGATFAAAGYAPDDIAETLDTLRQRGHMNKSKK